MIPTWCPGCSDYLLFAALDMAIKQLSIKLENLVIVYDIGCIGNMADFFKTYAIHSLHGRCIPTAIGVKLANPKLTVIAVGGDGGVYGEGVGHLLSAARLNIDITTIVANNHLYSLTTGQASPTTPKGSITKSTPTGVSYSAFDPINTLCSINSSVFAVSTDLKSPVELLQSIIQAVQHSGFSLIDHRQACVTFGK